MEKIGQGGWENLSHYSSQISQAGVGSSNRLSSMYPITIFDWAETQSNDLDAPTTESLLILFEFMP